MPAKNSTLRNGTRYNPANKETWGKFKELHNIDISYEKWLNIINKGNEFYAKQIVNNTTGVKFPEYLGHAGVTQYKLKTGVRMIDWNKSKEVGSRVYHTNFHSEGCFARIVWIIDTASSCRYLGAYKLKADRKMQRMIAPLMREGKVYNKLNSEHFRMGKIRLILNRY